MYTQQRGKSLFKKILTQSELNEIAQLQPPQILQLSKHAGFLLYRKIKRKPNQVIAFLSNYHSLILTFSQLHPNHLINNLSLHFINLSSYALIQQGKKSEAKKILKKSLDYLESTEPDALLLSIALNNLAALTFQSNKYFKGLYYALKAMQIMQNHIKNLKQRKKKPQLVEDVVVLINSYLLVCGSTKKITHQNNKKYYKELYSYASQKGLKKSVRYLGEASYFTQQFVKSIKNSNNLTLPVFRTSTEESTIYEQKIIRQLKNIQNLLTQKKEPEVIYVNSPPIPVEVEKEKSVSLVSKYQRVYKYVIIINDWQVEVQLLYEKGKEGAIITLDCIKLEDRINLVIGSDKMNKLMKQMNLEDLMPYDCSVKNIYDNEFIKYCILSFLDIDDVNKNIELYPRSPGLLEPFLFKMLKTEFVVFFHYINFCQFRLALCPLTTSTTLHLDVELRSNFMEETLKLEGRRSKNVVDIHNILMELRNKKNLKMEEKQCEKVVIKNINKLQKTIQSILKKFEIFLEEQLQENIQKQIQFGSFYKFLQSNTDHEGSFFYIRFLPNLKVFDIYLKSSQKSYSPDGFTKAKGNISYTSYQFQRDFGIPLSEGYRRIKCFANIVSKKYALKQFQRPLGSRDIEIYAENAITEVRITFKSFLRKMLYHENYMKPITACVVSINNHYPIGIKVSGYDPIECRQTGFFIHLNGDQWKWIKKPSQNSEKAAKGVNEDFHYKTQYFLVEWLERYGFRDLLKLIRIDEKGFNLKQISSHFIRLTNIIDIIQTHQ